LRAAARWQAAFWGANDKTLAWAGPRPTTAAMVADTSLWRGLLNDARSRFPHIVTQEVWRRRYALIETMSDWHKVKDALPATLAHNDFNQRNVGFRKAAPPEPAHREAQAADSGDYDGHQAKTATRLTRRLLPRLKPEEPPAKKPAPPPDSKAKPTHTDVGAIQQMMRSNTESNIVVLDWEIAQCNTAARDLVELLTFVLPPTAEREAIDRHVETLRDALIKAGVSTGIERDAFFEGFRSEIKVQAINRIGLQLLFGAQFQLAYLVRINATIERLLDLYH
jgi:hypothetical protein